MYESQHEALSALIDAFQKIFEESCLNLLHHINAYRQSTACPQATMLNMDRVTTATLVKEREQTCFLQLGQFDGKSVDFSPQEALTFMAMDVTAYNLLFEDLSHVLKEKTRMFC